MEEQLQRLMSWVWCYFLLDLRFQSFSHSLKIIFELYLRLNNAEKHVLGTCELGPHLKFSRCVLPQVQKPAGCHLSPTLSVEQGMQNSYFWNWVCWIFPQHTNADCWGVLGEFCSGRHQFGDDAILVTTPVWCDEYSSQMWAYFCTCSMCHND